MRIMIGSVLFLAVSLALVTGSNGRSLQDLFASLGDAEEHNVVRRSAGCYHEGQTYGEGVVSTSADGCWELICYASGRVGLRNACTSRIPTYPSLPNLPSISGRK